MPQPRTRARAATDNGPWVILLPLNVAPLILGMFMETIAIMIIPVPILIPLLTTFSLRGQAPSVR